MSSRNAFKLDKSKSLSQIVLDWSKLEAFIDEKINTTEKLKFVSGRVKNIVEKGENAGYQQFLLVPQLCFQ